MDKDILQYLPYYLGCEFWTDNSEGEINATTLPHIFSMVQRGKEVKPLLRKLESMSEDECLQCAEILGNATHISEESRIHQIRELFAGIHNQVTNIPGSRWFKLSHYLLSLGFDLFGLIDAGLAVDKQTIKS